MFKLNRYILKPRATTYVLRFKSKQTKTDKQKNDYQKTLNLPNPGQFELSMKNICQTEEKIKQVNDFLYEAFFFVFKLKFKRVIDVTIIRTQTSKKGKKKFILLYSMLI